MNAVFADTFYWVALTNPADSRYQDAVAVDGTLADAAIVTTDEVLSEFLTFFAEDAWLRSRAARTTGTSQRPRCAGRAPEQGVFSGRPRVYQQRPDKEYSLIDCISMQTMRRHAITEALTNDRHFEQEGFRALFRDS